MRVTDVMSVLHLIISTNKSKGENYSTCYEKWHIAFSIELL